MQQKKVAVIFSTTIFTLLLLTTILTMTVSTQGDATDSLVVSVSTYPTRIQEGDNTTITIEISNATANETFTFGINVSDPAGTFSTINISVTADTTGSGSNLTDYWGAFTGANTTNVGTYSVAVENVTTNEILAATSFTVGVWLCQILARDLANEPVSNLIINVYNKTNVPAQFLNLSQPTNETGWVSFMLATGNYTFEAFWKQVKVGSLPLTKIENDSVLEKERWVQLSNLKITVKDGSTNEPLPFIQLRLEYNYTTEANENLTETNYSETNFTGTVQIHNLFVNNSYVVEATRYGASGLSLPIQNTTLPLPWNNITIKFPVYTTLVHVVDSKNNAIEGVRVEAHEWSSGLTQNETTDSDGNVTFSLTFGRYRVRVYNGTILLNETLVDLTQNQSSFLIYLSDYNIDFTIEVADYFGQPIANAMVQIERKIDARYEVTAPSSFTGSDGRVTFSGILGGDSRISVYIGGQLSGTRDLHLTDSEKATLNLNGYVVIAGYAVETSQLVTAIAVAILVVVFIVALAHKRLLKTFIKSR